MLKPPRRRFQPRTQALAPAAVAAMLLAPACRAELTVTPTADLRTTYTDNVNLAPEATARSQIITELAPGLTLNDRSPALTLTAAYQLHLFHYADQDIAGTHGADSQFQGNAKVRIIDGLLYLNASGSYSQQAISAFGPPVQDDAYVSTNRAAVKAYRFDPYLIHSFGHFAGLEVHYSHDVVDSNGGGLGRSVGNGATAALSSGTQFERLGWGLQYAYQKLDDTIVNSSRSKNANANVSYAVVPQLKLTAGLGHDAYDYPQQQATSAAADNATGGRSWTGGIDWAPSTRTHVQASIGRRYYGNSDSLNATHRSRATVWVLTYGTDVTTSRQQFLLPSAVSTSALLDSMFAASIPDPVARAQAVNAFIYANGLPASLADSVNYFSNNYILQKQWQLSAAINSARTSTILALFDTRRQALSAVQSSSVLLGNNSSNINDDSRQQGGSATLNWRLSPLSSVNASAMYSKSTSLLSTLDTTNRSLRLMYTRQFARHVSGDIEVRREQGGLVGGSYRENAIVAHVVKQF